MTLEDERRREARRSDDAVVHTCGEIRAELSILQKDVDTLKQEMHDVRATSLNTAKYVTDDAESNRRAHAEIISTMKTGEKRLHERLDGQMINDGQTAEQLMAEFRAHTKEERTKGWLVGWLTFGCVAVALMILVFRG